MMMMMMMMMMMTKTTTTTTTSTIATKSTLLKKTRTSKVEPCGRTIDSVFIDSKYSCLPAMTHIRSTHTHTTREHGGHYSRP